eukprot:7145896-Prymnesium_polylepis.1
MPVHCAPPYGSIKRVPHTQCVFYDSPTPLAYPPCGTFPPASVDSLELTSRRWPNSTHRERLLSVLPTRPSFALRRVSTVWPMAYGEP